MSRSRGRKRDISAYLCMLPYALLFFLFILVPIALAVLLSFTDFNGVGTPSFVGLRNYKDILTQDEVLMQHVIPNTIWLVIMIGPFSLMLQFLIAWLLAHVTHGIRTVLALIIYSPSMTSGITVSVIWKVFFSGDRMGYLNSYLLSVGWIREPIQFLSSTDYILPIVVLVTLWSSMGVGFLSILTGIVNNDPEMYEAAYVDGLSNPWQEMLYITIPSMKPAMLFAATMCIVNTFSVGQVAVDLTGANPTPQYAGQTFVTHIADRGFLQYEMGYAAALSVLFLLLVFAVSRIANKLFLERGDER